MTIPEVTSRGRLIDFLKKYFALKGEAGGGSGAPTNAQYIVRQTDSSLSRERVITAGTNIAFTDAGDGGAFTIAASGGVDVSGTPSNNQIATFTDSDTVQGESNLTFDGSTLTVTGDASITGNTTLGNANSDTVTLNGVAAGVDNTVLVLNSSNVIKTDEIDSRVWGSSLVDVTGTPSDNQIAVWTDADTVEGTSNLTFNGTQLYVGGDIQINGNDIKGSTGNVVIRMDESDNVSVSGDLLISGNDIKNSADQTVITLGNKRVSIPGRFSAGDALQDTGQRAEFHSASSATYGGFNGLYYEKSAANNSRANTVLESTNQQYDMLGPGQSSTTLYHYGVSATPASTAGNVRRFTDGSSANNFTGQHNVSPANPALVENLEDNIGLIVVSNGSFKRYDERPSVDAWVTGKEAITIAEALPIVELATLPNDKRAFGVISNRPNEYLIDMETGEYEEDQDGTAKGFGNIQQEQIRINSIGEGALWVCNISGNLENGDYITTCEIPGFGMKQADDLLHNYTVAKITQDCDFDLSSLDYICEEFTFSGSTYRKAFVGCTYHCG